MDDGVLDISLRFQVHATTAVLLVIDLFFSSRDRMRRSLFPAVVIIMWLAGTNVF